MIGLRKTVGELVKFLRKKKSKSNLFYARDLNYYAKSRMIKKYKVKVSYRMLIVIFLLFFVPVIFGIASSGINREFYILVGILVPTYSFILYMFLNTEYKIENETLKIRCGVIFNKTIEISKIRKISRTSSLMSSPAPSFDRIEIKYGKFDEIIISPKNKLDFVNDLVQINKRIENSVN